LFYFFQVTFSCICVLQEFLINQKRPKTTRVTQVIQGYESHAFKSKFESWPVGNAAGSPGAEEGRGKVAGMSFSYEIMKIPL
jgi:hypothetical protein